MKFASVKQAVKFGIGAGLPPDKQTSVKTVKCLKCQTTSSPPHLHLVWTAVSNRHKL
jgi:hypothetical protein